VIHIDRTVCIMCQQCILSCPEGAIASEQLQPRIDYEICTVCGKCIFFCPEHAIKDDGSN